ncbi:hypothetical protein U9M48_001705 [Paspalum notatum var. saurae]|uniref:Disease resistance protein RPM1 n=1 Tax=Paspalum notatum var. saurae TaxID=547442 RepID=A0AAQ3PJU9_PASNO
MRSTRYNLMSDAGSKAEAQMQPALDGANSRAQDLFVKETEADMDQIAVMQLKCLIATANVDLQVVSVCGTGGDDDLGLTSIVRRVYEDPEICSQFKCRAWVKLVHPFNSHEFVKNLADQFYTRTHRKPRVALVEQDFVTRIEAPAKTIVEEFTNQVNAQKYLIILEDLSSMAQWDAARMYQPDMKNGSRIIVSARQRELASLCVGRPYRVSPIRQFSPNHSVLVFFKDSSTKLDNGLDSGAEELEEMIDSACGKTNKQATPVVSVWRKSGNGESSLVRDVYESCKLNEKFDRYAWVHVPQPFEIVVFCQSLASQLDSPLGDVDDVHSMVIKCRDLLHGKRSLLVIDGLESVNQWESIRVISDSSLGCIVVVTWQESVARHCATNVASDSTQINNAPLIFEEKGIQNNNNQGSSGGCLPSLGAASDQLKNCYLPGRHSEVIQLEQQITSASSTGACHVVSVWGISGVGKSRLVRTVYYRCLFNRNFEMYAWVHAPTEPKIEDFCKNLLSAMWPAKAATKDFDPLNKCRDLLHKHHCLLVIDRLESKDSWEYVKSRLSLSDSRSCIVVTTRDVNVATHSAMNGAVFHIKGLESDAALDMFKDKECRMASGTSHLDQDTMGGAKKIFDGCGRLCTATDALSSYLASKPDIKQAMRYLENNFTNELKVKLELGSLKASLDEILSSFRGCPQVVKKCCFYLSVFPQGSIICRSRLLRRWIAEGYSEGTDSSSQMEYAKKLFDKLADLGIIGQQPNNVSAAVAGDKKKASREIYSLIVEYIISCETEESILVPLEISVLKGESNLKPERVGQHLAITSCWRRKKLVFDTLDLSRLRSLTVSGKWQAFLITDKMRRALRVLDLEGSLRQLQTLDIRGTGVAVLPQSIVKLQKLQYFCARTRTNGGQIGAKMPKGIGRLTALRKLGAVHGGAAHLAELQNLEQLESLHVSLSQTNRPNKLLPLCGQSLKLRFPKNLMKLKLYMPEYSLCREDILTIRNLEKMRTLCIHVKAIDGGLLNFLLDQGGAGNSSDDQRLGQLNKVIKIVCDSDSLEYDNVTTSEQPKLSLEMPTYCLTEKDILAIGKVEKLHTLCIRVEKIEVGLAKVLPCMRQRDGACCSSAQPGQLKVIHIACTLGSLKYDGAALERPMLTLEMPTCSLTPEDIVGIGSQAKMHLCITAKDIDGGLLNLLLAQGGAGSTLAQCFGQPKVIEIACRSGRLKYDGAVFKQHKIILEMPASFLTPQDILGMEKVKNMHSLRIIVNGVHGGLLSVFLNQGGAGTIPQLFRQLKVLEIICYPESLTYDGEVLEQPKLTLHCNSMTQWGMDQYLGKLKGLHTLSLHLIDGKDLTFSDHFCQLKALEISCCSRLYVEFAEQAMKELELLKFGCFSVSAWEIFGLEFLPSLKEVCLQGPFLYRFRENLQSQLDHHQKKPVLKLEQQETVCLQGPFHYEFRENLQSQLDRHQKKPVLKLEQQETCPIM